MLKEFEALSVNDKNELGEVYFQSAVANMAALIGSMQKIYILPEEKARYLKWCAEAASDGAFALIQELISKKS